MLLIHDIILNASDVRDKRLKLQRNSKGGLLSPACVNFLEEPFYLISSLTSPSPKAKRKKPITANAAVINQVFSTPPQMCPEGGVATHCYQSLLEDNKKLLEENEQLKMYLNIEVDASAKRQQVTRPLQENQRQHAQAEKWKHKYMELKKKYACATKHQTKVQQLRKSVRRLTSLLTSQRHYFKSKMATLQAKEAGQACEEIS